MAPSPLIVSPADRPRALNIAGTAVTILASGAQTAGYEIFHTTGPEGTALAITRTRGTSLST